MKRAFGIALFTALLGLAMPRPADARVNVSVWVGVPFVGAVVGPTGVYVGAPIYGPPPVYAPPAYYGPAYYPYRHRRPPCHGNNYYRRGRGGWR